ncbi:serine hydrolase-like protein [Tribolium castaneum]|uniref:Putative serine hydrolase-like Protein n=1 Tax=Tribolium castaneum TaxID=7070 RepID=D2A2H1_TRICA|nr:PREDICTED: serine hydrolase-like protein [Tribolium castaneum]EFA02197.1 putative serine hydrolase-like Protein [Tribolium castaneum]|eukprot:XP_967893.2 PREDICTED: serine hydrolase-like protein [Tribolium castaneum]
MNTEEITITVPWGHLAAKIWGNKNDPLVLVFHGIMDNAGSFDRLIPLLPKSFCYICFDLPGHGKSSHFPPFFPAYTLNNVLVYKIIVQYFKKEKYTILGHSYGGQIAFLFAQLYPEYVEKLIMLDTIHLFPVHAGQFRQNLRDKMDFCIELDQKIKTGTRPTYTYAEALQKLQDQRANGYISREAAEALLQRAIERTDDGKYAFTVDQRMKQFINPIHDFRYILETLKKFPVTCPVLMVLGRDSELQQMYMKGVTNFFKKYRNIRITYVDGHHDVHNNSPEIVAPHVSKFLVVKKAKL